MKNRIIFTLLTVALAALTGCETTSSDRESARTAMIESIRTEPAGDYYIGRRCFKEDYKMWGFIRKPGQPWSTAKLVMLNEQKKLAPDRDMGRLGSDHGYEYKMTGTFSGDTVYEPASNGFYPEFVVTSFELRTTTPAPIFHTASANDPKRRIIGQPY
jgi:hypothetical protein